MPLVELEYVAAHRTVGQGDVVANATGNNAYFVGSDKEMTELRTDVKNAVLEDNQKIAICAVEGRIFIHGFPGGENEHAESLFHGRVTCTSNET